MARGPTIGAWLVTVFAVVLVLAGVTVHLVVRTQEEMSISNLAETQARRTSELVFAHLYSVMRRGWSRPEIDDIVRHINAIDPEIAVSIVRGAPVAAEYGEHQDSAARRRADPALADVFRTGHERLERGAEAIRYLFPLKVDAECQACHSAPLGTVNGVIDVAFPLHGLRVPLDFTLRAAAWAVSAGVAVLFVLVFLKLRFLIVGPIVTLAGLMRGMLEREDLTGRVHIRRFWPREVRMLGVGFNTLMAEVEESRTELADQAARDGLTGLYNRRRFDLALNGELARARRYGRPLTVLAIDLDGFKPVNDRFGHAAGDRMLIAVAHALRGCLRAQDLLARVGGDEFLILLPETTAFQAQVVAEKVRRDIANLSIEVEGEGGTVDIGIGASLGVAAFPDAGASAADLLAAADAGMYDDKRRRRTGRQQNAVGGTAG